MQTYRLEHRLAPRQRANKAKEAWGHLDSRRHLGKVVIRH